MMGESNEMDILEMMAAHPIYDGIMLNFHVERALHRLGVDRFPPEAIDRMKRLGTANGKALMMMVEDPESRDESRLRGVLAARDQMAAAGIAVYPSIERATQIMGRYVRYEAQRRARG